MRTRQELRNGIYEEFSEILDASNELIGTADGMKMAINEKGVLNLYREKHELVAGILFADAYSRFIGVKILCEEGLGNVSQTVLRSLFNLLFEFHWILQDKSEERAQRYLGWFWKKAFDHMTQFSSDYDVKSKKVIRDNYKIVKHFYTHRIKKHGKVKIRRANRWYYPSTVEGMAKDAGLALLYEKGYRELSKAEHVDPEYLLRLLQKWEIKSDPGLDKPILNEALVMNFSCFLNICQTVDSSFSLGKSEVLDKFVERQNRFKRGWEIQNNEAR